MAKIPLVDLKAQYQAIKDEIDAAIGEVLANTAFIGGAYLGKFEENFAGFCGARHAVGVSSGTSALHLALLACGVQPGDEVITTTFTFVASVEAIWQAGARPVLVDIEKDGYNIDPAQIEEKVTSKTKVIMPVHLYGHPAGMEPICKIARGHGLKVIEDAAQAHGATYKGRQLGELSDAACFSFYPGKNLGAYGDGGVVVTNDDDLAARVRLLRDHGRESKYEHLVPGYCFRLDALQAAILDVKLKHLAEWNARRVEHARCYNEELQNTPLVLPKVKDGCQPVYHLYVVRTEKRDGLMAALKQHDISAGIHYPIPVHHQPAFRYLEHNLGDFPHSEKAAREVLSLPMYPELNDEQIRHVSGCTGHFFD